MSNNEYYKKIVIEDLESNLDSAESERVAWEGAYIKRRKDGAYPKNWNNSSNCVGFSVEDCFMGKQVRLHINFHTKKHGYDSMHILSEKNPECIERAIEERKTYLKNRVESLKLQIEKAESVVDYAINRFDELLKEIKRLAGDDKHTTLYYDVKETLRKYYGD